MVVETLICKHSDVGGTMGKAKVLDRGTFPAAQEDPKRFPDLLVRVTGFSAYIASLYPEMRPFVVDRIVQGE